MNHSNQNRLRQPSRSIAHPLTTLFALIVAAITYEIGVIRIHAETARPDLRGIVQNELGQPMAGATVFIYTAGPRRGVGVLCPSCYLDCRKRAVTGRDGRFVIESLDPDLIFRVLVVAKERQPEFISQVDPAEKTLTIKLKPVLGGETPEKRVLGRVVDPEGKPVVGAVINVRGVTQGDRTRFGGNTNLDPVAVTDSKGEFVVRGQEPFDALGIDVEARGYAKAIVQKLVTGGKRHELKLTEGVTVRGRVQKDGRPLAGIEMGVAGADRSAEQFVGDFTVATDAEGRFLFANLPPQTAYVLYGRMQSLGDRGSIPARPIRTAEDASMLEVGDIAVQPGFTVAGKVRLTDGKALATNTQIMLSRSEAWDQLRAEVDKAGGFVFKGVPAESVHLSTRVKGYRLSLRNRSLAPHGGYSLAGRVTRDQTNLVVEFEPGEPHAGGSGSSESLRNEPLQGAEATAKSEGDIRVTGTVIDADTRQPVAAFSLVEGRQAQYGEGIEWMPTRRWSQQGGVFTLQLSSGRQAPAILVEAEGYRPLASGLIGTNGTNFAFVLKKGGGPAGTVLRPDGSAASEISVYLADLKNGVYIDGEKLAVRDSVYRGTQRTKTGPQGRFSFPASIDAYAVMVVDESGYADVPVAALEQTSTIRLQPYARVEGRLMIGKKPGGKEAVRLGLAHIPYVHHPRSFPPLSLFLTTRTDDDGNFVFERVPPIPIEVYHEPKVRDGKMGTIPQAQTTKFALKPGEVRRLELGGRGRPVIGKLVVKGYPDEINFRADVQSIEAVVPRPAELPDLMTMSKEFSQQYRSLTNDAEKAKLQADFQVRREKSMEQTRAFFRSQSGQDYHLASRRDALNFQRDGSFRIEDIPAGKYSLRIELREETGSSPNRFSAPVIARLEREFEVPSTEQEYSEKPFDLGEITAEAVNRTKVGQAAPDFSVKTIDDRPLKLADFRGKYLLLDFWAVWCGPCVAETPYLKATWEAFKNDRRFAMVGLSLDPEMAVPREYAGKNGLGWIQGFLGDWSSSNVPARFGVEGIPSIFLIGPDGNILAKDLRGEGIQRAVEKALAK